MPWYQGETLLAMLETISVEHDVFDAPLRFPVQYVNRPNLDFRGYAGTIASGTVRVGQAVKVLPSGVVSRIKSIVTFDGDLTQASVGQAVTLVLEDEVDVSRGDLLVASGEEALQAVWGAEVDVVWMAESALKPGHRYDIKLAGKKSRAHVERIVHQYDINTLELGDSQALALNAIGTVSVAFDEPLLLDRYETSRETGSFIFIDPLTNVTVGAGLVKTPGIASAPSAVELSNDREFEKALNALIRHHYPHWNARDISQRSSG